MANKYQQIDTQIGGNKMTKRRKKRIRWSRLLVLLMLGYFLYMYAGQEQQMRLLDNEIGAAQAHIETLKSQNEAYQRERDLLQTDSYVEKVAREELGLVKPGETPYIPSGK